jgi:hypothetical protein
MKKIHWLLSIATGLVAALSAEASAGSLSGTYELVEHYKGVEAPDRIEFRADGSCVMDLDGAHGAVGKYHADSSSLTIDPGGGSAALTYQYRLGTFNLVLSKGGQDDLYYGKLPAERPHVQFTDLTGMYSCHNEAGDSVCQVTANHEFHIKLRELSCVPWSAQWLAGGAAGRVYNDVFVDGTCSYADGVTFYKVEHYQGPEEDQSVADVVIKRDNTGLWVVDAYRDKVVCQPVTTSMDLPPPPFGYSKASP